MNESFDPAHTAEAEREAHEFDRHAESYDVAHRKNVAITGEGPEYFANYKRDVLARLLGSDFASPILDFGCGIGNLTCLLAERFPDVHGYDPSSKSVAVATKRAAGARFHAELGAVPRSHFGAVILANVLHHVARARRAELVGQVCELLGRGGRLIVFEHNPMNPLTRWAVATCPFDVGVKLLWPWELGGLLRDAGLRDVRRDFIVFFPRPLAALRPLERKLRAVPLGAQVVLWATRAT
jgi:2-polyprenyl-3-methyl-5-hydroxy-6-metoxy-1,4-benzoquinol methylase